MCAALVLASTVIATTGCKWRKKADAVDASVLAPTPAPASAAVASPPASAAAPQVEDFSGVYVSNFGTTVTFTQTGTKVESSLTARHGRITCTAEGLTLKCDWSNGGARGKEVLVKQPDGTLKGTFGNGSSSTGGSISFTKKPAVVASTGGAAKPKVAGGGGGGCPAGLTKCPTGCENLMVSMSNCGSCGHFCPTGTMCNHSGVCE